MDNFVITALKRVKHNFDDRWNLKAASQYRCFVPNINLSFAVKQPRVLLSYNPCTFQMSFKAEELTHSNGAEITEIIHILAELNCCVDVIDCTCRNPEVYIGERHYDYIIGFGIPYEFAHKRNPNAITVFIMTEQLPSYVQEKSRERYEYYYQRHHKKKYGLRRSASLFKDEYLVFSDYSIRLCDKVMGIKPEKEFYIFSTGLVNQKYLYNEKNFEEARHHFVWFGSPGAIHKGLDILIDVFAELPGEHLHIYGLNSRENFLLKGATSNIHNEGMVKVSTKRYIDEVVNKNAYVILPSCSEGMPTGVITNILHGLIPITSAECNMPIFDFGYVLSDFKCEYIKNVIQKASEQKADVLSNWSKSAYGFARENFVIESYSKKMRSILQSIIK